MKTLVKKSTKRENRVRYAVYFVREASGGYTAHIPGLGIVTEGRNLREARAMARDAIAGRLAVLRECGQPIPREDPEYVEVEL